MTDLEIAQGATMRPISDIARAAGIQEETLSPYGRYIAKVDPAPYAAQPDRARLVLVTAINPTPAGEGKTTVSVGLADGLTVLGKKSMLALREPSLGPVFGMKGGATGGGYAQVLPMEQINLHFTGDLHAITSANNLLAAMVDNHIQQGNALGIDPRRVTWRRCMDVNDRQLRQIVSGLGGKGNGMPREDGFDITAASEVMAVLCLARDLADLKARLGRLVVARTFANRAVTAADLKADGAMTALLRDALQPNLVQTIDGTPCLMHGGPFANIAHGCNSVIATRTAMKLADYVITEAGFGGDLGAEKFLDIKCRQSGLWPDAIVLVATVRALKHHGGCPKEQLNQEGLDYLDKGMANLLAHIDHIQHVWKRPVIVAINRFSADTPAEMDRIREGLPGGERSLRAVRRLGQGWPGCDGVGAAGGRHRGRPAQGGAFLHLSGRHAPEGEDRDGGPAHLRRGAGNLRPRGTQAAAKPHGGGLRRVSGMHCQDAVFLLGQSQAAGSAQGFHPEHPRGAAVRGRGIHGGLCGGYYCHARAAQGSRCGGH